MESINTINVGGIDREIEDTVARTKSESSVTRLDHMEADIAGLHTQVNEIIAPTGEAPNPSEVIDARIDVNNITHQSLGDAIRDQIAKRISENSGKYSKANVWDEQWVNGSISTRGDYQSDVRVCTKNFIPVEPDTDYYTNHRLVCCFYDSAQRYISDGRGDKLYKFTTPSNAHYMKFYTNSTYDKFNEPQTYHNDIFISRLHVKNYSSYDTDNITDGLATNKPIISSINQWDEEWVDDVAPVNGEYIYDPNATRVFSKNLIPIMPSTTYYVTKGIVAIWYDENGAWLSNQDVNEGIFETPSNAHYMRFYTLRSYGTEPQTYNNDVSINYPASIQSYYPYNPLSIYDYIQDELFINVWDEQWVNGSISTRGDYQSDVRVCTKNFIKVKSGESYFFTQTVVGCFYDADYNYIRELRQDIGAGMFTIPNGVSYLKFYTLSSYDADSPQTYKNNISINSPSIINTYCPFGMTFSEYLLMNFSENNGNSIINTAPLSVGAFNIHKFSNSSTGGCDPSEIERTLPMWKSVFIDEMQSDILLINEWWDTFDREGTMDTYETIFEQFYPYHYKISNNQCILSKFPLIFSTININLDMIMGISVEHNLAVVCWLQSNLWTVEKRMSAYRSLINNYLQGYSKVIIAGDFNNDAGAEELSVFTDAGFILGNNGYWGQIDTCTTSTNPDFAAIDNIVTKGFIMKHFDKVDNRVSSDHYPVIADLQY